MECVCKYAEAVRRVCRVLRERVNPAEFSLLMFILDRTYAFNKAEETISMAHFVDGISGLCCGVGLKERAVRGNIAALAQKALITVTGPKTDTKRYSINIGLISTEISPPEYKGSELRHEDAEAPAPRCQSAGKQMPKLRRRNAGPIRVTNARVLTSDINKGEINKGLRNSTAAAAEALSDKINRKRESTTEIKNQKRTAGKLSALKRYWFDQLAEYFPGRHFADFTPADEANFKRLVQNRIGDIPPREFITFVFSRWVEIKRNKFPRMLSAPDAPTFGFVFRFVAEFLDAWSTVAAGMSLLAKDRSERIVVPLTSQIEAQAKKIAGLERRVGPAQSRVRELELQLSQAQATVTRLQNPGLSASEIYHAREPARRGKGGITLLPVGAPIPVPDLSDFVPEEFE